MTKASKNPQDNDLSENTDAHTNITTRVTKIPDIEPTLVLSLIFPLREAHELKYRAKKSGLTVTAYLIETLNLSNHV